MENNFQNNFNKRIFEKLETKIAIENFKEKEKHSYRSYTTIKIASILIIIGIITGNIFTYAKYNENIFSWALNKIGMFQTYNEEKTELNIVKENNGATLTLMDYGVDGNTLIIGYALKLNESEKFVEKIYDSSRIISGTDIYGLEDKNTEIFNKISNTEYIIYELYTIDGNKLNDKSTFETDIKIYKEFINPDVEPVILGNWNFNITLDEEKINLDYKEYIVENKSVKLENINNSEVLPWDIIANIISVKKSRLTTKLVVLLEGYTTDPNIRYFVEILDENGNTILENNTTYTIGGVPTDIIFRSIPDNSKITVNIYETSISTNEIYSKGSVNIDFTTDLKEKDNQKEINKVKKQWRNIEFEYNELNEIHENSGKLAITKEPILYSLNMSCGDIIQDKVYHTGFLNMISYKNALNLSLEEIYEVREKLEYYSSGYVIGEFYNLNCVVENKSIEASIDHNQMMKFLSGDDITIFAYGYDNNGLRQPLGNKTININNVEERLQKIKFNDKNQIKLDGIDTITYTTTTSETKKHYIFVYNDYIYEVNHTSNFDVNKEMEDIIKSIKFI